MKVNILGIEVDKINLPQTISRIGEWLSSENQHLIVTVNPEFVVAAQHDQQFKNILNQASLATCDGTGLAWAARFLHRQKLIRVTGVDLAEALLNSSDNCYGAYLQDAAIYLLGGDKGVAQKLKAKYPKANVVGAESGGKLIAGNDSDWTLENNADVIKRINDSGANILLVAFPQVRQEIWLSKYLPEMPEIKIAVGVGGTFDYLSGRIKRPPLGIRKLGLEWLYRLIIMPQRAGRIYNATVKFGWLVIMEKMKRKNIKY